MEDHKRAERFFTKAEKGKIKQATAEAESRTIGEIATMVVDHSSEYVEAEIIGGIFLGSVVSLILAAAFFHSSLWFYVPCAFVLFFPSRLLFKSVPALKVAFMGRKRRERAVKQRALRAFYEKGLYKTEGHTGMLFFISLLERKVWVLADKGIHGKIHQNTFNKLANAVSYGIKDGHACDALVQAIQDTGELLAKNYPLTAKNVDELPNGVMYESETKET